MFTFKPRSAATLTARCGTQLLIKRHFSRASTSPCIACSKMFSSVNQMLKARSIHSITEALIKQQQHFLKAGGRQGSLTGGRGEGHDWLAQNTRGNPRKAREGERITNTGQDGLTTVSLSKAKNSRRKRQQGGTIITMLLTEGCKNRRDFTRMRFYQKFSLCQVRSSGSISQHNGASHKAPKLPQHHSLPSHSAPSLGYELLKSISKSLLSKQLHYEGALVSLRDAPCTLSILKLLFITA